MRYMLFLDHKKLPARKANIFKEVFGDYTKKKNVTKYIMAAAQHKFLDIFGLRMVEVSKKRKAKRGAPSTRM